MTTHKFWLLSQPSIIILAVLTAIQHVLQCPAVIENSSSLLSSNTPCYSFEEDPLRSPLYVHPVTRPCLLLFTGCNKLRRRLGFDTHLHPNCRTHVHPVNNPHIASCFIRCAHASRFIDLAHASLRSCATPWSSLPNFVMPRSILDRASRL